MNPFCEVRNRVPSSTALVSESAVAVALLGQIVHGQVTGPLPAVIVIPADGASMFPLSSAARLRIRLAPVVVGVDADVTASRPVARCHVVPLSVDTSTPPTRPPPASVAVPLT